MKDIHVLLNGFTQASALKQTLTSLQLISHRVNGVTVLWEGDNPPKKETSSFLSGNISYFKKYDNETDETFHSHICSISSEYLLILNHGDYINANIQKVNLELKNKQNLMTYFYRAKKKSIQYPFFIKTSFFNRINVLLKYKYPFNEAMQAALLLFADKSEIFPVNEQVISHITKAASVLTFQKLNFIEKYRNLSIREKDRPSLSIMISNYNMVQYLGIAISSCLLQGTLPNQILVIDDGSTDQSYKELEKWRSFPEVKVFRKVNGGKARALNELLPHIESEYVLELDADDWLDPDAVSVILSHLKNLSNDVVVLYGNLRNWKQRETGALTYKGIRKGNPVESTKELLSYKFPLGPRIYRTASLKQNNGFPISSFENGRMFEDVSILYQLLNRGRLLYKDFTVYNVREHELSITKRNRSNWNDFLKYLK